MKRLSLISQLLIFATFMINPLEGINFEHASFDNTNIQDIKFVQQDSWYTGQNASYGDQGIWLTPNPADVTTNKYSNIGRIVYKDLVQFMNNKSGSPKRVASFHTSFSFQIITSASYNLCGSGMAFVISDSDKAPIHSDKGYLGLFNPQAASHPNFFAVEFDTHISTNVSDPSASHIGIDINSLNSSKLTDTSPYSGSPFYPELYLYNNYSFTAWIDYNSATNLIQVWMMNETSGQRPSQACLQFSFNLSSVFHEYMYVGFSATNEAGLDKMEGHVVKSWSFYSEDLTGSGNSKHSKLLLFLAITLPILLALSVIGLSVFCISKRMTVRNNGSTSSSLWLGTPENIIQLGSVQSSLPRYTYKELKRSANGFADQNKVGEGGYSSVYRATLADGSIVAIKRLKEGVQKEAEFLTEMNIINSIRHRNLLQLRGWCYEKGE
eukprot:c23975_g3_i2 orf=1-1311(-)